MPNSVYNFVLCCTDWKEITVETVESVIVYYKYQIERIYLSSVRILFDYLNILTQ